MKKFSLWDVAALVIWLLPLGYLLLVYGALPAIVPIHYGLNGKPDGYSSKNEFLLIQLLMPAISACTYFLLKFLPAIDPKKKVNYGEQTFQKLGFGLIVFLAALSVTITYVTVDPDHILSMNKLLLPLIGLLFVFLGNMMYSIKPNYFAGVRTPWTLEDEGNWRATHRLAGKVWVAGGLVITIAMLLLPSPASIFVFLPCVMVMALIPIIYSYMYFKKHQLK
jgi:uncharacterized membrane protein